MKVCIAVPTLDMVSAEFAFSLAALLGKRAYDKKLSRDVPVALIHQTGSIIMEARNALVAQARAANASHILFLDSDMVFPPDTLDRLLAHRVDIVCATYVRRTGTHELLGQTAGMGQNSKGLIEYNHIPLGCCLIRLSVFDIVPRPWFAYLSTPEGTQSEDIYFSLAARRAGHTIWCDPKLTSEVGHIGTAIYRPSHTTQPPPSR